MASSSLFLSHLPISSYHSKLSSLTLSTLPRRLARLAPLAAMKKFNSKKRPRKALRFDKEYQRRKQLEREEEDDEDGDVAIPQIVTDRMMSRVGFTVGVPLSLGLAFFPFFYYLKKVVKVDVPTWIPFGVSFIFFGSALLGISYGIVSASWDPLREGSWLGWNEARKNLPVFWDSLRGNKNE